ncbi:unnamed protein product [Protopolystoma xenopodis]|uniref:Pellino RING domain-containing protein n=1 Tax=Protopolystoma xenopodis TaxID=117903 RepID=A0A448XCV7_9PLAT|nr:unnamed protein product [Protopolystoma xenopodis]
MFSLHPSCIISYWSSIRLPNRHNFELHARCPFCAVPVNPTPVRLIFPGDIDLDDLMPPDTEQESRTPSPSSSPSPPASPVPIVPIRPPLGSSASAFSVPFASQSTVSLATPVGTTCLTTNQAATSPQMLL